MQKTIFLIILTFFINALNAATIDLEREAERTLVREYHSNGCGVAIENGNIGVQKNCLDIINELVQISHDKQYLFLLGEHYLNGILVTKDVSKGLQLYEEVANSDSIMAPKAQKILGILYVTGVEIKKDLKKAEYWLKKAATNDPDAQFFYAALLQLQSKHKQSLYWYKKAASNNVARAQYKLADLFIKGHSIGIDRKDAYRLLHKAADQNFAPAFQALGIIYEKDNDKKNSNYWYCTFANSEFFKNLELGIEPNEALNKSILSGNKKKYLEKVRNEKEENMNIDKGCQ